MLAAFARGTFRSRLLSLRCMATEATSAAALESDEPSPQQQVAPQQRRMPSQSETKRPAWWSDPTIDAYAAFKIIKKRFAVHGSQREENYRQLMKRIRNPQEAGWAFQTLVEGRKHRAVLQQHVPFTFHTSQLLITKCVEVRAFNTALEAFQRAEELGLQFFRADAYHAVMKGAVMNKQLDVAVRAFESMKANGIRPGTKVVHNLIAGSIFNGRPELAHQYAEEFKLNGIKINKASQEWLDGIRKPVPSGKGDFVDDDELDGSSNGHDKEVSGKTNEQVSEKPNEQVPAEQEKATATTSA